MPAIKNALLRYRIIDRSIRNEYNPYPTKEQLRQACEEEIYGTSEGLHICHSTIEKDIFAMSQSFWKSIPFETNLANHQFFQYSPRP